MADDSNIQIVQSPEMPVLETKTIGIQGMTCQHCVQTVERALRGAQGVKDVSVDLAGAQATVTFDTRQTDIPRLHDTLLAKGYHPTG